MKVKAVPAITFYLSLMLTILVLLFGNEPNKSQYILVIETITVFYIAYITNKITSPASLLVISSFVFLGCRPLLSLFANYDYRIADWFIEGYMDDDVILANYAITLMYYGYTLGLILCKNTEKFYPHGPYPEKQLLKIKFLLTLFFLGSIGMVVKGIFFFNFIESNSYVDIYQSNITTPIGYDFLSYLFYCSFFLICAFHIQFRTNKKFLFIAICIAAFSTLKGSRSEAITFLLTVTCIYFNEVKTRNLRLLITMIFVFSVIFVISEFISMWRTGGSFFQLMQGNNPVINFVYGMGVSYLSIYQSVKLQLLSGGYNVTYLFSQLIITCSSIFNVKLSLPEISYSHLASYTANPELYNLGFGLGGSYLAESFLAFGLIGCFIIPFLLLLNLNVLEKYTKNKPIIYFVYYSVLPPILFTPRETLFYFFPYLVKSIFVAFLVTLYIQYKKD